MFAHVSATLLQRANVHTTDGTHRSVDVRISDGVIAEIGDAGTLPAPDGVEVHDLGGRLLLPAAVEPHAHLDKAFLAELITNETGDLMGAILALQANRHLLAVDETIERAERAARRMADNGFFAVRTHADTTAESGLVSLEALLEVKRRVADVIDVEIVALIGWPLMGADGADQRELARTAMSMGPDLLGGVPHLEETGTRDATAWLLELATDTGVGVDLHTDETLDPDVLGLVDLAELVLGGFEHPATASHCVSLGMQTAGRQQEIAELVAAAGVSVIALPHTNLFLQGRGHAPMPRALTAIDALERAGATVAAGGDNLQDPFNPVGRACPFETAALTILTAHRLPHQAWEMVSSRSARATGRAPAALEPGSPAHLIAVDADTVREAIAFEPRPRHVWHHGVGRET